MLRHVYTPLQHFRAEKAAKPGLQDAMPLSDELFRRRASAGGGGVGDGTVADSV